MSWLLNKIYKAIKRFKFTFCNKVTFGLKFEQFHDSHHYAKLTTITKNDTRLDQFEFDKKWDLIESEWNAFTKDPTKGKDLKIYNRFVE